MKRTIFFYAFMFSTLLVSRAHANIQWYDQLLTSAQKYHSDFILKAKETKTIIFYTDEKLLVGFWTNPQKITNKQISQYVGNFPVSIEHVDEKRSVKSLFGSSVLFHPIKGKIEVEVKNLSDEEFEIVVYTHPLTFSD